MTITKEPGIFCVICGWNPKRQEIMFEHRKNHDPKLHVRQLINYLDKQIKKTENILKKKEKDMKRLLELLNDLDEEKDKR